MAEGRGVLRGSSFKAQEEVTFGQGAIVDEPQWWEEWEVQLGVWDIELRGS